jgi:hypothetical protein
MIAMEAHGRINAIKYFFRVIPWLLNKFDVQLKYCSAYVIISLKER